MPARSPFTSRTTGPAAPTATAPMAPGFPGCSPTSAPGSRTGWRKRFLESLPCVNRPEAQRNFGFAFGQTSTRAGPGHFRARPRRPTLRRMVLSQALLPEQNRACGRHRVVPARPGRPPQRCAGSAADDPRMAQRLAPQLLGSTSCATRPGSTPSPSTSARGGFSRAALTTFLGSIPCPTPASVSATSGPTPMRVPRCGWAPISRASPAGNCSGPAAATPPSTIVSHVSPPTGSGASSSSARPMDWPSRAAFFSPEPSSGTAARGEGKLRGRAQLRRGFHLRTLAVHLYPSHLLLGVRAPAFRAQ